MEVGRDISIHYSVVQQDQARPSVTGTLPRDVGTLVGRTRELASIVSAAGPGRVISIHTIDGMAGIGKTALVTRAAHQLAAGFPDGQYFVELHAHTPGRAPADPADVLARLLTDVGVDSRFLPSTLEGRRDLWLDRTAGKRILLILDDARDHTQVEPLLPGTGGCLTLITSRRHLTALDGAVGLPLDVLDSDTAAELFITLARRTAATDAERAAVAEIVRLCGYLPLAIVLLAGRLAHHRSWSISGFADEFAAAQHRLAELEAGPRSVQVAFTMSYQDLPPGPQRMFRRLGLHPGPDIDVHAAAALASVSVGVARRQLEAFYTDHLIEETQPGRYRLHDLLRAYARVQADTDPTETNTQAMDRLLNYYQVTAAVADRYVARYTQPAAQPVAQSGLVREFDDKQALAWLRLERENLLACLDYTIDHQPRRAIKLTETLAGLLEHDGPWQQAANLHHRALATARSLADGPGEANALVNLGVALQWNGDYSASARLLQQALALYRESSNRLGEANSLFHLGSARRLNGEYDESTELHQQALDLYRELGNRLGEAYTLMNFGLVRMRTGIHAASIDAFQQALVLFRELDHRFGEAFTLINLGDAFNYTGDYAQAAERHQQALTLCRELGHQRGEAEALAALGRVRRSTGDYAASADLCQQALSLHREIGNRSGEAFTITRLGDLRRLAGDYAESAELHQQALTLSRELGHQHIETKVLNHIGTLLRETGEVHGALKTFTDALVLARSILDHIEQAHALEGSARCRIELGDTVTAVPQLREAVEIYQRLAAPEADATAAYLAIVQSPPPAQ
ncbi:tetratricopeptide repeat protein [Streptomyces gardneri]|nr:tetratricopeptide repeat protein [Streptomyces gardneri]